MPFDGHLSDVYNIHIQKVCAEIGVSCHRGDDLFTTNNIIDDIWSSIFHAKVIVADCTFRNPNVFYELGIAHALGKPVILLTQGGDDVPFDLKQRRYIEYGTSEAKRTAFETKLKSFIRDAMSK